MGILKTLINAYLEANTERYREYYRWYYTVNPAYRAKRIVKLFRLTDKEYQKYRDQIAFPFTKSLSNNTLELGKEITYDRIKTK